MAWRLAKSLIKLRSQINEKWPSRSKVSDGTIGDPAHSSRVSDHNPNAQGVVTAFDCTHDPVNGLDGAELAAALIRDNRTKYVIFRRSIWKARTGLWEPYRGPNPHDKHVHLSIKPELCDDESTWALTTNVLPVSYPTLKLGDRGQVVRQLQDKLRNVGYSVAVDGIFGRITESAVKAFQERSKLTITGIADGATWTRLSEHK